MTKNNPTRPHSIRVPEKRWRAARARAKQEGHLISAVINAFLEAYARGTAPMPHLMIDQDNQ